MYRGHLLVMVNRHVKYEDFVIDGFENNQWKSYCLLTEPMTDQLTLINKAKYPRFFIVENNYVTILMILDILDCRSLQYSFQSLTYIWHILDHCS